MTIIITPFLPQRKDICQVCYTFMCSLQKEFFTKLLFHLSSVGIIFILRNNISNLNFAKIMQQ